MDINTPEASCLHFFYIAPSMGWGGQCLMESRKMHEILKDQFVCRIKIAEGSGKSLESSNVPDQLNICLPWSQSFFHALVQCMLLYARLCPITHYKDDWCKIGIIESALLLSLAWSLHNPVENTILRLFSSLLKSIFFSSPI